MHSFIITCQLSHWIMSLWPSFIIHLWLLLCVLVLCIFAWHDQLYLNYCYTTVTNCFYHIKVIIFVILYSTFHQFTYCNTSASGLQLLVSLVEGTIRCWDYMSWGIDIFDILRSKLRIRSDIILIRSIKLLWMKLKTRWVIQTNCAFCYHIYVCFMLSSAMFTSVHVLVQTWVHLSSPTKWMYIVINCNGQGQP